MIENTPIWHIYCLIKAGVWGDVTVTRPAGVQAWMAKYSNEKYRLFGESSGKNDFGINDKLKIPAIAVSIIIAFE